MESVTVITEPLLHRDFVQFEIVVPILERLQGKYDITVAAPRIAPLVQRELEAKGVRVADGKALFPPIRRSRDEIPSFVFSWARDTLWGWNRRDIERALGDDDGMRINVSMTTAIDADVWLIQSRPLGQGLDAMRKGVTGSLRVALTAANPFVGRLDHHHIVDAGRRARVRYSTTRHVGDWFASQGLPVQGVLPMYYRSTIFQSTRNPSRDYILVYVGKETDTTALRMLLDTGLPVTMFGSKSVGWVLNALELDQYPHARMLGYVTDAELRDLYSNARFVAFPFTEEPFGLVPLESMACGTPVLTYGIQGPAESVLDQRTGWLVRSPEEFVRRALDLWNAGVPSAAMVGRCLARARIYHIDTVSAGWKSLIETAIEDRYDPAPKDRPGPLPRLTSVEGLADPNASAAGGLSLFEAGDRSTSPAPRLSPILPIIDVTQFRPEPTEAPRDLAPSAGYRGLPKPSDAPALNPDDYDIVPYPELDSTEPTQGPSAVRGPPTLRRASSDGSASTTS